MPKYKDIAGQRFGRVVALSYLGKSKWHCKCDCGKEFEALMSNLVSGKTKSSALINLLKYKFPFIIFGNTNPSALVKSAKYTCPFNVFGD